MGELIINKNGIEKEVSKSTILSGEVFQLDPTKQFKSQVYTNPYVFRFMMVLVFCPYRKVRGKYEYIARLAELNVKDLRGLVAAMRPLRTSIDILNGEITIDDGEYPVRTTYISIPMHEVDKQDDSVALKFGNCHGVNAYIDSDSKRLYIYINNKQYKMYYYVNLEIDDIDDGNSLANNDK